MPQIDDVLGPVSWNPAIIPDGPASITVPSSDSDGNFKVSWAADGDADHYELAEGVEQPDTSISWGSPINVGNVLEYDVTGKTAGFTYWYRVRSVNAGSYESDWTTSTNGCTVQKPSFLITPDLGWPSIEAMFSSSNQKLAAFPLEDLDTTTEEPAYVKNRNSLVFAHGGTNYKIPGAYIDKFGANGLHYWRFTDESIQSFYLSRTPLEVEEVEALKTKRRFPTRILGV